jgi:predicted enzyme related to lactoylglutathione lyase
MLPAAPGLMLGLWRRDGVKPPASHGGGGEIAFAAKNEAEVDALCAGWRARGIEVAQAPTSMDFGYTFVALDPDGQRVRVFAPAA